MRHSTLHPQPVPTIFVANVTAIYNGTGTAYVDRLFTSLIAISSRRVKYNHHDNPCPNDGPPSIFPRTQLLSRESETGNVCWTIAASDAASLELFIGQNFAYPSASTWFALH